MGWGAFSEPRPCSHLQNTQPKLALDRHQIDEQSASLLSLKKVTRNRMVIEFRLQVLLEGGATSCSQFGVGLSAAPPSHLPPCIHLWTPPMPKFGFFRYSVSQNDCIALLKLLCFITIVFINHNPTNNHYVDMQIQIQGNLFLYFTSNILQKRDQVFFKIFQKNVQRLKLRAICNFQGLISSLIFFFIKMTNKI